MGLQMSGLNGNPLASNLLNPAGDDDAGSGDDDDDDDDGDGDDDYDDDDETEQGCSDGLMMHEEGGSEPAQLLRFLIFLL